MIGVTLLPEYGSEVLDSFGIESRATWSLIFNSAFWYQLLLKGGNRVARPRFVSIVTLDPKQQPELENVCRQRAFMARLLERLESVHPAVIVVDKYFSPHICPPSDEGTTKLLSAVSATTVPVVVGLQTLDADELDPPLTSAERAGLKTTPLVVEPFLRFTKAHYGLIRLNRDNRKIPLDWLAYESRDKLAAGTASTSSETLSLLAANLHDPKLLKVRKLADLRARRVHPYTGFLEARPDGKPGPDAEPGSDAAIPTFSALELICGKNSSLDADWEHCAPPKREQLERLGSRIVVIGGKDKRDLHPSVLGMVPGVVLQANYIEALLNDAYLLPVPPFWNVVLNVVAAGFIGFLFVANRRKRKGPLSPVWAAFVGGLVTLLLCVLSYFAAVLAGYYLPVWFPGLYALGMLGHSLLHRVRHDQPTEAESDDLALRASTAGGSKAPLGIPKG